MVADFENGLCKIRRHSIVHMIDPNPMQFRPFCHAGHKRQLDPANDATVPTCWRCIQQLLNLTWRELARLTKQEVADLLGQKGYTQ